MSPALFFAVYCVEAGLFFIIVPWTSIWMLNPLLHRFMSIAVWADNPFVRGFVSGLGLLHLIVGVRDLMRLSRARRGAGTE